MTLEALIMKYFKKCSTTFPTTLMGRSLSHLVFPSHLKFLIVHRLENVLAAKQVKQLLKRFYFRFISELKSVCFLLTNR